MLRNQFVAGASHDARTRLLHADWSTRSLLCGDLQDTSTIFLHLRASLQVELAQQERPLDHFKRGETRTATKHTQTHFQKTQQPEGCSQTEFGVKECYNQNVPDSVIYTSQTATNLPHLLVGI